MKLISTATIVHGLLLIVVGAIAASTIAITGFGSDPGNDRPPGDPGQDRHAPDDQIHHPQNEQGKCGEAENEL